MTDAKHTPGPLEVQIHSTCSGAWPVIVQRCVDPETQEEWFREIGETDTAFVEKDGMNMRHDEYGVYGGYDEAPSRFKPTEDSEESLANAHLWAAAPDPLAALQLLEVSANTVAYCYDKRPENFASAMQDMHDAADAARAAIARAEGRAEGEKT